MMDQSNTTSSTEEDENDSHTSPISPNSSNDSPIMSFNLKYNLKFKRHRHPSRINIHSFIGFLLFYVILLTPPSVSASTNGGGQLQFLQRQQQRQRQRQEQQQIQCSCTPQVYRWRIDFTKSCTSPSAVQIDEAIEDLSCTDTSNPSSAPVVAIHSYQILEFGDSFQEPPLTRKSMDNLVLTDGDVIDFQSSTDNMDMDVDVLPGGLSVFLEGVDSNGEKVILRWIGEFSNSCDVLPFQNDDSIGWLVFKDPTRASRETCPYRKSKSNKKSKSSKSGKFSKSKSSSSKSKKSKSKSKSNKASYAKSSKSRKKSKLVKAEKSAKSSKGVYLRRN